jgi:hypothetical protein
MRYTIEQKDGYLKAEMLERETPEETVEFVNAVVEALRNAPQAHVLISTRQSRPVFKVEDWKLSEVLQKVMGVPGLRVGFISDSREIAMSQEYIALLGRQRGLEFETFSSEQGAVIWLTRP